LIFTAPPSMRDQIKYLAKNIDLSLTRIGRIAAGAAVRILDLRGQELSLSFKGYTHFDSSEFES